MRPFRPLLAVLLASTAIPAAAQSTADQNASTQNITVTASRVNMLGRATTASQGSITRKELVLRPIYRVGQLLESVPSLVVTVHSGEGKANQYLMRGFNLDHGTDLATFIDDMPVNLPTNAHGQGYTDLNFFMPQLAAGIDYGKGPFEASVGDFGAVAYDKIKMVNNLPAQVQLATGTKGYDEGFVGDTYHFKNGINLLGAFDAEHVDGPWTYPENYRRINATTRLSKGDYANGWSVMAMYSKGQGRNDTDQPLRAVQEGVIGEYGSLDSTDANRTDRWSVDTHYGVTGDDWKFSTSEYVIRRSFTLWNDFTHYLNDPVNGDQEQQDETRLTGGGQADFTYYKSFADIETDTTVGLQDRADWEYIDRRHTHDRVVLDYCNDGPPPGTTTISPDWQTYDYSVGQYACTADRVHLNDVGAYIQNTTYWLPWLRTILGVREDLDSGHVKSVLSDFPFNEGTHEYLLQPKATIVFGPWHKMELYISAGKGFHSDDLRGVLGAAPLGAPLLNVGGAPLMAKTYGEEIGIRNNSIKDLDIQFAVFRQDFSSEQMYNQDAGEDQASAPSRRNGVELSAQYRPFHWIELNTDLDYTQARYLKSYYALENDYGIYGGRNIANAPRYIASFGILVDNLGNWFGGLAERILGPQPLTDGPFYPSTPGYAETNIDVGYKFTAKTKLQFSVYNLFNTHAYSAEYYYGTYISPAERAADFSTDGYNGVSDYQIHPLEPISVRLTLTQLF